MDVTSRDFSDSVAPLPQKAKTESEKKKEAQTAEILKIILPILEEGMKQFKSTWEDERIMRKELKEHERLGMPVTDKEEIAFSQLQEQKNKIIKDVKSQLKANHCEEIVVHDALYAIDNKTFSAFASVLVPRYDLISNQREFHGSLSQTDAENALSQAPVGSWLIRLSLTHKGFVCSLKTSENAYQHIPIPVNKESSKSIGFDAPTDWPGALLNDRILKDNPYHIGGKSLGWAQQELHSEGDWVIRNDRTGKDYIVIRIRPGGAKDEEGKEEFAQIPITAAGLKEEGVHTFYQLLEYIQKTLLNSRDEDAPVVDARGVNRAGVFTDWEDQIRTHTESRITWTKDNKGKPEWNGIDWGNQGALNLEELARNIKNRDTQ